MPKSGRGHAIIRRSDRPRHDIDALHHLRSFRENHRAGAARARADLSAPRFRRARCGGDLAQHAAGDYRCLVRCGVKSPRPRRDRHHQSARDDASLGQAHRRAFAQCAGLAGYAHRRADRGLCTRWRQGSPARSNRLAADDIFLQPQIEMAARHRAWRARRCRSRRRSIRHDRLLACLEPHRRTEWRPPHHRRDQRLAHAADEPAYPRLGRGNPRSLRHSARMLA